VSAALPVRYRPTSRQLVGRAVRSGLLTSAVVAVPVAVRFVGGNLMSAELIAVPLAFVAGALVSAPLLRRGGVDVDETGIHPVLPGAARRDHAAWQQIIDIRAERRGARTVPVVYMKSGRAWRLRVPYDGPLLGRDPHFDEKLCTLRNMWDTYKSWQRG
jgi:hypothetical protein